MTENKPIIINGCDVSGCEYYDKNKHLLTCICEEYPCSECSNCYFKQLNRKTQECEELKKNYFTVIQQRNVAEQQLDQLKAKNENLKNEIEACYNQVEDFDIIATSKSNKLKQAEQKLKEIRKYCNYMAVFNNANKTNKGLDVEEVIQIIDEVE